MGSTTARREKPDSRNDVVALDHVWAEQGDVPILEDVSLTVQRGDFLGVIGPNGGGKSTLLRVILGLVEPVRGEIKVLGKKPEDSAHLIGYVPQHSLFDPDFPIAVQDVVLMGRLSRPRLLRRFDEEDHRKALAALETVGIRELRNRPIGHLSGGEQQRTFIARALVRNPSLLLLDEALSGIDPTTQSELYDLLSELAEHITIIMVSHDLSAISTHVDKVACLNHRLHYHGSKEIPPEDIEATYGCPVQLLAHGVPHRVLGRHE